MADYSRDQVKPLASLSPCMSRHECGPQYAIHAYTTCSHYSIFCFLVSASIRTVVVLMAVHVDQPICVRYNVTFQRDIMQPATCTATPLPDNVTAAHLLEVRCTCRHYKTCVFMSSFSRDSFSTFLELFIAQCTCISMCVKKSSTTLFINTMLIDMIGMCCIRLCITVLVIYFMCRIVDQQTLYGICMEACKIPAGMESGNSGKEIVQAFIPNLK